MTAKEYLLKAIYRQDPHWVPNGEGEDMSCILQIVPPVIERPKVAGLDDWGVEYELDEEVEGGTYPKRDGHLIKNFSNWREEIMIPDVNAMDWKRLREQYKVDALDRENILVVGFVEFGIFERMYMLLGMEDRKSVV